MNPARPDLSNDGPATRTRSRTGALKNTASSSSLPPRRNRLFVPKPRTPGLIDFFSSDNDNSDGARRFRVLRTHIVRDIGDRITLADSTWAPSLYHDLADDHSIDKFLAGRRSGYKRRKRGISRWTSLPIRPCSREELFNSITALLSSILSTFTNSTSPTASREVVNGHALGFKCEEKKDFCPTISIRATGPSFERPLDWQEYVDGVGYTNVASVFDVCLDCEVGADAEQAYRGSVYCRQIFINQPNRNFVRFLLITETRVRMFHYDRSGVFITPFINIHDDPATFIRLVVGLSSIDEGVLGLDTSVQWTIDPLSGRKSSGTLEVVDAELGAVAYELAGQERPFIRPDVCGRGTTAWHATDPRTGEEVLVKDSWRASSSKSEIPFLEAARGVQGVAQLLASQDNCASTSSYRPDAVETQAFSSRTKSRVVLKRYGKSVDNFTTRYEAIAAVRDALIGHRDLLKKEILHKDVSIYNILLGNLEVDGVRGVLIDLDMASWTWSDESERRANHLMGARAFQSIAVLESIKVDPPPPHDYLDDLESFYYVLCHLLLIYEGPGVRNAGSEEEFAAWYSTDPITASQARGRILGCSYNEAWPWWGDVCDKLLNDFQSVVCPVMHEKHVLRGSKRLTPEMKRQRLEALTSKVWDHYDSVIGFFEEALTTIEQEDAQAAAAPNAAPLPPSPKSPTRVQESTPAPVIDREPSVHSSVSLKRASDGERSTGHSPKRARSSQTAAGSKDTPPEVPPPTRRSSRFSSKP